MKNARGSKSARTPKLTKPPAPVTADSKEFGTVTIPDAAPVAAARAKVPRQKKPADRVIDVVVPDWAKRAEAGPALANAVETAAEPAPEMPTQKEKSRATKAEKPKTKPAAKEPPPATPGSLRAIGQGWLESLRKAGHTPSTISSYGNDLEIAYEHLGANTVAAEITERQVAGFNASKYVTKKANGKPKAQPTILKTRRALRLALVWAEQKGLIKKAPYSAA